MNEEEQKQTEEKEEQEEKFHLSEANKLILWFIVGCTLSVVIGFYFGHALATENANYCQLLLTELQSKNMTGYLSNAFY